MESKETRVLVNFDTLVEENLSISDFAKPSIEWTACYYL